MTLIVRDFNFQPHHEGCYEKEDIFQIFVLSSRKYIGKVFSVFGRACKSIFQENIFPFAPQYKTFYRKMPKKYTYITIEHLKIPIHIIYAHPLQNSNHKKYEHIHI